MATVFEIGFVDLHVIAKVNKGKDSLKDKILVYTIRIARNDLHAKQYLGFVSFWGKTRKLISCNCHLMLFLIIRNGDL